MTRILLAGAAGLLIGRAPVAARAKLLALAIGLGAITYRTARAISSTGE